MNVAKIKAMILGGRPVIDRLEIELSRMDLDRVARGERISAADGRIAISLIKDKSGEELKSSIKNYLEFIRTW